MAIEFRHLQMPVDELPLAYLATDHNLLITVADAI